MKTGFISSQVFPLLHKSRKELSKGWMPFRHHLDVAAPAYGWMGGRKTFNGILRLCYHFGCVKIKSKL